MQNYQTAIARILLSLVFLGAVILQLLVITSHPNGYIDYQINLGKAGLPGVFAPLLILVKLVAGIALLIGYKTRFSAYVLAALAIFLGIIWGRSNFDFMFIYFGIAGGMLMLATYPQTGLSMDNRVKKDHIF